MREEPLKKNSVNFLLLLLKIPWYSDGLDGSLGKLCLTHLPEDMNKYGDLKGEKAIIWNHRT